MSIACWAVTSRSKTIALLAMLKLIATPACYSSGNAGGIFGPSLFIGAMIGGTVGGDCAFSVAGITANPGAYALVGMGTAFAGIVRTPLTSVIMIFEMTRDYSIIVPLMISNLISFFISYQLQREPIYEALALQEGVYLPTGESREEFAGVRVGEIMKTDAPLLSPDADVEAAKSLLTQEAVNSWPVGKDGCVFGVVSSQQIETAKPPAKIVRDLGKDGETYPHAHSDHPVSHALERMRTSAVDVLPVVSRADIHQLLGVVILYPDTRYLWGRKASGAEEREQRLAVTAGNPQTAGPGRHLDRTRQSCGRGHTDPPVGHRRSERAGQVPGPTERAEMERAAQRSYVAGMRLLEQGKADQAVELLREAHAQERQNPEYELGLISALMAVGKTRGSRRSYGGSASAPPQ